MAWMDNTGLYQKYGTEQVVPQVAGEYKFFGGQRYMEVKLDLTALTSTATIIAGTDATNFPAGFTIDKVEVEAETAAVGATATLDIGLQKLDRSTEIDYQAFVKALPVASIDTKGETSSITKGATGAGDLMGTTVGTAPGYLTANYNTAAFTAGVLIVRIFFRKP